MNTFSQHAECLIVCGFVILCAFLFVICVAISSNPKKLVIDLLISTVIVGILISPLIIIIYNDVQQQKLNKKDNEMSPFKVYERCIEQFTYFVVCDTRLPYPQCIKAYHKNWYKAQDQCRELNMNAKEKTNQKGEKDE